MTKRIIWIDDDIAKMRIVAANLFPTLWEKGFSNQIIFAGNDCAEDGANIKITPKVRDRFNQDVYGYFVSFYSKKTINNKTPSRPIKELEKELMPDKYFIQFEDTEDVAVKNIKTHINKESGECELLIGLDIRLFDYDEKLEKKSATMDLFAEYSSNEKYIVFLYSTFTDDDDVKYGWNKLYKECYPDNEDVYIFSRDKLLYPDDDNKKELNKFLKKLQKK